MEEARGVAHLAPLASRSAIQEFYTHLSLLIHRYAALAVFPDDQSKLKQKPGDMVLARSTTHHHAYQKRYSQYRRQWVLIFAGSCYKRGRCMLDRAPVATSNVHCDGTQKRCFRCVMAKRSCKDVSHDECFSFESRQADSDPPTCGVRGSSFRT